MFEGRDILHLPTVKTHGHSITTGAVKNAFGGLLKEVRHYAHKYIHEVLVDLLIMQRELHPNVFAVMDGTVCGDGAGPRTMDPVVGNVVLASADSVAIDAVAARIMGFDPMSIPYLRMATERGLGEARIEKIEIAGEDIGALQLSFQDEAELRHLGGSDAPARAAPVSREDRAPFTSRVLGAARVEHLSRRILVSDDRAAEDRTVQRRRSGGSSGGSTGDAPEARSGFASNRREGMMKALAAAKINLYLDVLRRREDGYHEIETLYQPVSLWDELTFEKTPSGIKVEGDDPAIPWNEDNLCHRAARLILESVRRGGQACGSASRRGFRRGPGSAEGAPMPRPRCSP